MRFLLALALMCSAALAQAAVQTREIRYQDADGTPLIGYYAYDDALDGKRPGIVVVHEWWGLNDYAKRRARDLAALGYNALAIDMYGDGKHTEHPQDAQAFMAAALKDPAAAARRFDCSSCNPTPTSMSWVRWATASAARWCSMPLAGARSSMAW